MKRTTLFVLLGLFLVTSLSAQDKKIDIVKKGDQMPTFTLESSVNGQMTSEMLKGKVVLITIFATWCPPCQKELKALDDAIKQKQIPFTKDNTDLAILVVGREHKEDELEKYLEKKQFSFPIYPDPTREFTSKFATQNIPRTYLIDRTGKIVYASVGYEEKDFKGLIKEINTQLKKK